MRIRPIDRRFKPPVKGIDLWQALNYIALEDVSPDFIYNRYTAATPSYVKGSRPALERLARKLGTRARDDMGRTAAIAQYVAQEVPWAGYYERKLGKRLPVDRNLSEEEILKSGFGWCNEQARLFCSLAQLANLPARLVFACNRAETFGHVVAEVLTKQGWMLVDQSFGHCFTHRRRPSSAWEVAHRPALAKYHAPIYRRLCDELKNVLGTDILSRDFKMAMVANPLCGFERLGYCNHWT